ncbi:hypothetical protein IQ07DRAFT_342484 [Pyrenochaeta sp. DS3sAY3a]|nr:hypothetical protein IQ07DRAFT_342484 [Pyrenochaeta sp. DS3sAY3a]
MPKNMDRHSEFLGTFTNTETNAFLAYKASNCRPYQAYCNTVASSRASSPDLPSLEPFGTQLSGGLNSEGGSHFQSCRPSFPRGLLPQYDFPTYGGQGDLANSPETETKEENGSDMSNHRGTISSATSLNSDHITQAVTLREGQSFHPKARTGCHEEKSFLRVQRRTSCDASTYQNVQDKSSSTANLHFGFSQHPLPPLPIGAAVDSNDGVVGSCPPSFDPFYHLGISLNQTSSALQATDPAQGVGQPPRYQHSSVEAEPSSDGIVLSDSISPVVPHEAKSETNSLPRSLTGPSGLQDDRVPTELQPNLLPLVPPEPPGLGPRPPPWGSFELLERQRRRRSQGRGSGRGRSEMASAIHAGLQTPATVREDVLRREVQGYREQVLRVYPEMKFDGGRDRAEGCCYCCIVL